MDFGFGFCFECNQKPLFWSSLFIKQSTPTSLSLLQAAKAASRPKIEDTSSGRPCREKLTGEIFTYPGLSEGRIEKVC